MRKFFVIIGSLLCLSLSSHEQNIDSVSKINIEYFFGKNALGSTEYAHTEIFEFERINSSFFKISQYALIKYTERNDNQRLKADTIILPTKKYNLIPISFVKRMLIELNTNRNNFNAAFIQPYLKVPSKSQIQSIAVNNGYESDFKRKYSYKEDRDTIFKRVKRFYMLDSFLSWTKPDNSFKNVIAIGEADVSSIKIMTLIDTIKFISRFYDFFTKPRLLGQPIERINNGNYDNSSQLVNLKINLAIRDLLPNGCYLKNQLDLNSITEQYIIWFLKYRKFE